MTQVGEFFNTITRPFVTLILIAGLTWGFANRLISGEVYATIVSVVAGYWFGKRDADKQEEKVAAAAAQHVVDATVERRGNGDDATVARRAAPRERE